MDVEKLKQKILDLAIRGKLVPQDPDDEPASVLIEKIRAEKENLIKQGKIKRDKNESYIFKGDDNSYYEKVGNDVKKIAVPFNIPDSWIWCRIGSYVPVITDYVASGSFASLNENVKYYQSPNYAILVRTCDFKTNFSSSLVWTDKHGYEFLSNSNLFGGELILSNIGASIGKVFIVPKLPYRMTLAPNSIMVKATNDELNKYLLFVFQSAYGQNLLKSISFSSAQAKFNKTDFRKQLIPVPPLNEQIKLMHHLESLFLTVSNIAKYYNDITILAEQLKNKILDSFFGENSRYKSYYTEKPLCEIAKIIFGQSPNGSSVITQYSENGIEFHQGKTSFGDYYLEESNRWCIEPTKTTNGNSIVMSVRAPVGDVNICKRIICIGRGLCSIEPYSEINEMYLFYLLLSKKQYLESKSTGSTFSAVNSKTVKEMKVVVCEDDIQRIIVDRIEKAFSFLDGIVSQ